jgi:hypothetical protein
LGKKVICFLLALIFSLSLAGAAWAGYSITISKASNKLALYKDGTLVRIFPVATGKHPSFTPEGKFTIASKLVNPYYGKGNIPGGSPNNPLGPRWLGLSIGGGGTYGIHGNNNPASVGTYASAGCIRMYDKDVIWLYDRVPIGTPVTINNTPINEVAVPEKPKPKPKPIKLLVNNKIIPLPGDKVPKERDNHIFIPLRPAAEKLGYKLIWHYEYDIMEIVRKGQQSFIDIDGDTTVVHGRFHRLPAGPLFQKDTLYVPLEFFNLFAEITARWDNDVREVTLVSN